MSTEFSIHHQVLRGLEPATDPHATVPPQAVLVPPSLDLSLDPSWLEARLLWWDSAWAGEWSPRSAPALNGLHLAPTAGRSSARHHPFLVIDDTERALVLAVAWSGNWRIEVTSGPDGLRLVAGLPDGIHRQLPAGATWTTPDVLVAHADSGGVGAASEAFVAEVRDYLGPLTPARPVWNHWWPYEDAGITAEAFVANAAVAARCGIPVAVLDAGWFGDHASGLRWTELRGDWDLVNTERFPGGLTPLAAQIRAAGADLGLWIEFESVGSHARLRRTEPELLATGHQTPLPPRPGDGPWAGPWPDDGQCPDGVDLGYVCLGDPRARNLVVDHVLRLAAQTDLAWLKLDFNTDPGLGCTRTGHGHGPSDGLIAHVEGLYEVLDRIRAALPGVVVETCSSGGMRWDLGIARHCDVGFVSDTDWPEHAASTFWAASTFFPPERLYGWCDSEWGGTHPHQTFHAASAEASRVADSLAVALLGQTGLSQRLVDFPADCLALVADAMATHSHVIAPALGTSVVRRHGRQPEREKLGGRWPILEFAPVAGSTRLLASLPLDGPATPRPACVLDVGPGTLVRLQALFPGGLDPVDARAEDSGPDAGRLDVGPLLAGVPAWYRVSTASSGVATVHVPFGEEPSPPVDDRPSSVRHPEVDT